jgi:hypothetical protein
MNWKRFTRRDTCPVCNGQRHDCRQNLETNLIHCFSTEANPLDYIYRGQDSIGFNLWAYKPDVEEWTDERRQEWQLEQQRKRALREQQDKEQLKKLLPIKERDQVIRQILDQLTLRDRHREILKRRGLTDSQIDEAGYRSVKQWQKLTNPVNNRLSGVNQFGNGLINKTDGILIPIPNEDGLYTLLRVNDLTPDTSNKYYPCSSRNSRGIPIDLPNGEKPIAVYWPELGDSSASESSPDPQKTSSKPPEKQIIGFTEGLEYKPLLASNNLGIPVIGASGGNFACSQQTILQAIDTIKEKLGIDDPLFVLYADAGSGINPNVTRHYEKLGEFIPDLKIADWGQLEDKENGLDIDEMGASHFCKTITQSNDKPRLSAPLKKANVQKWDAPDEIDPNQIDLKLISVEEFAANCPKIKERNLYSFKDWLGKGLKKLAQKKANKLSKKNPFGEGESYTGNRAKKLLEEIRNGFDVLDNTFMGDGKSHSVLEMVNTEGNIIYLSKNHRNPSLPGIKQKYTDVNPRTQWGFYLNNEGLLVEASELINPDYLVTKPNCIRGDWFKSLKNKGYDVENGGETINPICANCPLLGECSKTPGMYKHDKKKATEAKHQRTHPDSLSRDKDYSKDLFIFDEPTEQLTTTQNIIESWEEMIIELDRFRPHLTSQQPSTLKENVADFSTSQQPSKLKDEVTPVSTSQQHSTLKEKMDPVSTSQQPSTLKDKVTPVSTSQQPSTLKEKMDSVSSEDDYQFIDSLVQKLKPLFKNKKSLNIPSDKKASSLKYGLEHENILGLISIEDKEKLSQIVNKLERLEYEFICELMGKLNRDHILGVDEFDHEKEYQELKKQLSRDLPISQRNKIAIRFNHLDNLRNEFKAKIKRANSQYKSKKNTDYVKDVSQKVATMPPNGLINIFKALLGDTNISLRIAGNECHMVVNDPNKYAFLKEAKKIYLDSTIDPNHLQKLIPSSRPLKVVHRDIPTPLQNLEITNINTPGLKTNNPTKTATNRSQKVLRELNKQHGDMALITHKGDIMDKDGYYFRDNIGSNKFEGNPNLCFKGTPNPNYGAIMDQYRAIYGNLEGFEAYYDRLIKAQILQGVGRQRCQRYPEQKFRLFMIATDLDLDFLKDYGCKISNHHSLEYHFEAGSITQVARLEIFRAIDELKAMSVKITQVSVATHLGKTRQAVSKLLKNAGVTLGKLVKLTRKVLSTRSIKEAIEGVDRDFPLKELRRFLELEPMAIAKEVIEDIKAMGWDTFVSLYLSTFPKPVMARIIGVLLALMDEDGMILDPSPPPQNE